MPSDVDEEAQVIIFQAPVFRTKYSGDEHAAAAAAAAEAAVAEAAVQLSDILTCQKAGLASVGAEGHDVCECVPCLMQVRWQAGRGAEPCKFGHLCGRCHEAHSEEELQKIQAKMRKQKKKHGRTGPSLFAAAFGHGRAAHKENTSSKA
eukprot:CAMPEP_0204196140 /NCGR_PEP_ID=MMETSP0361-20130328/63612_1 /ASSEMBLY_ACC=CAM_ASM_000343 /TAXON_ID=268821 /ORGANISM="Scrippsiella Hangoei, Strain SHTV-5" /LENGTH=148 /DNA_ID=CAMNT_0051157849 /DNA_START=69 /DNA_END=515 /DNA_ORIENTATION=+